MRVFFILTSILLFASCSKYHFDEGFTQGTTYHIKYKHSRNLKVETENLLKDFDNSLSTYNQNSVLSRINQNDSTVVADAYVLNCIAKALEISAITGGAFDITVAPLVNAWGFGFKKMQSVDSAMIQKLMENIGYEKIKIADNRILKQKPEIMIDCSGIAQGYSVDLVAEMFEKEGIENYMVEIGGEIRAKGVNPDGIAWRIGIDKPVENSDLSNRDLQDVVSLCNVSVSTSGNYRKFYEKDGVKYAHTIHPKTGYPANSNMLSATVMASSCMEADALATAFMVLGFEKSLGLSRSIPEMEVYFIYNDSLGNYKVYYSDGFEKIIEK